LRYSGRNQLDSPSSCLSLPDLAINSAYFCPFSIIKNWHVYGTWYRSFGKLSRRPHIYQQRATLLKFERLFYIDRCLHKIFLLLSIYRVTD
jgi:hypothetical protein